MKRLVAIALILALIFVMGCAKEAPVTPDVKPAPSRTPSPAPAEEAEVSDLDDEVDLSDLDDLETELQFEDFDMLDEELDFEI